MDSSGLRSGYDTSESYEQLLNPFLEIIKQNNDYEISSLLLQNVITITKDNFVYKGEVSDGFFEGKGELTYINKNQIYIGQFKRNKKEGLGRLYKLIKINNKQNKLLLYNGEWKNNKYHGVGIEEGNTFYYEGYFQNGKREGLGCYYDYETQQSFIGNWVNGYKEGKFCVKNLSTGEYSVKTFNEWSNL